LISANVGEGKSDIEIRKRLTAAMKAIFGTRPNTRADEIDDNERLLHMAEEYVYDQERAGKQKPRSIATLAKQAAPADDINAEDRLQKAFRKKRTALVANVPPQSVKIRIIQQCALHDIDERLNLFGIPLFPDDYDV
jgi:hypothetical protein